jgi:hypothetical protein
MMLFVVSALARLRQIVVAQITNASVNGQLGFLFNGSSPQAFQVAKRIAGSQVTNKKNTPDSSIAPRELVAGDA